MIIYYLPPFTGTWKIHWPLVSVSGRVILVVNSIIFNSKYIDSIRGPHFPASYVSLPEFTLPETNSNFAPGIWSFPFGASLAYFQGLQMFVSGRVILVVYSIIFESFFYILPEWCWNSEPSRAWKGIEKGCLCVCVQFVLICCSWSTNGLNVWCSRIPMGNVKYGCVSNEGPLQQRHVWVLELEVESMSLGGGFFDFKAQPNM